MRAIRKPLIALLCGVPVLILTLEGFAFGQSPEQKLLQKATFVPKGTSAVEQLSDLARHYEIPMGIELEEHPNIEVSTLYLEDQTTVQGLVDEILQGIPGYRSQTNDGVLHISNPTLESDPRNFLNLRISEFAISNASVFDADEILKLKIEMSLHPERYSGGWNDGSGAPPGHIFNTNNVTFSGCNLTVREILDKIVVANGNALWVSRLLPTQMMQSDPFFATYPDEGGKSAGFHWQFLPFSTAKNDR